MSHEIIATIIGGFIAAGAGLLVEFYKDKRKEVKFRKRFATAIKDDLKNSISQYEKIQDDWEKSSLIWFVTINEVRKSRKIYEKYNENILLFESAELRNRISKYYLKSDNLISQLECMQNKKYLIDSKFKNICMDFKLKDNSLTDEIVKNRASEIMTDELKELAWVNETIPKSVSSITGLISEAHALIGEISKTVRLHNC